MSWGEQLSKIQTIDQTIELKEGRTGNVVAGLVTRTAKHVEDYEQAWREPLRELNKEDKTMSWRFKKQLAEHHPDHEAYAIEYEDLTQGMILLETQNRWSLFTPGKRIIYIAAIVSAPCNRYWIQRPPELKGVGRSLLEFAKQRSLQLGFDGRVGLHSLSGAVGFYENRGMTRLELDPEDIIDPEDNVPYFEYMGRYQEGRDHERN